MHSTHSESQVNPYFTRTLADPEYNGALNRATEQGAAFALLLSMLEQNSLYRPRVAASADETLPSADIAALSTYRQFPLQANAADWQCAGQVAQMIAEQELANAQLWLAMHPQPLSLFNDKKWMPPEVIANCSLTVQQRWHAEQTQVIEQDVTGLYDILEQNTAAAA